MERRLTRETVGHVARLARLELTDEELDLFTGQLGAVLEHAADVEALDLAGVPATAHPLGLTNVLREDVVVAQPEGFLADVLGGAPAAEEGRFRVPRILGEAP